MAKKHILPDRLKPGLKLVFCGTAAGRQSALQQRNQDDQRDQAGDGDDGATDGGKHGNGGKDEKEASGPRATRDPDEVQSDSITGGNTSVAP